MTIDPKDREIQRLRNDLNDQKWETRRARESSFYSGYSSRPVVIYNDRYHPYFTYWLLSQSLDSQAYWMYHHRASMDAARYNYLLAQNAQLASRVAALQGTTVDPNYLPAGVDPDLVYSDEYVEAAYNPQSSGGGSGVWWFLGIIGIAAVSCGVYFVFIRRPMVEV